MKIRPTHCTPKNLRLSLFQLEQMYLRSSLSSSFDRVEVEAFSKGSIIVDYYVVFKELLQTVTTQDLKDTVEIETRQRNNEHMLGPLKIDAKHSDFIGKQLPEDHSYSNNSFFSCFNR